jgi:hypothetical protein
MPKKELKKRYNVSLYPSTVERMDKEANELGITRSDLIEDKFKAPLFCKDVQKDLPPIDEPEEFKEKRLKEAEERAKVKIIKNTHSDHDLGPLEESEEMREKRVNEYKKSLQNHSGYKPRYILVSPPYFKSDD